MRVIGGVHRSRKLEQVPSDDTRETRDRVKESIFNSIQPDLYHARVLDLFCGSGSLGIEALSHGASTCYFNDLSEAAITVTTANVIALGLRASTQIENRSYQSCLASLEEPFDVILLDPPYGLDVLDEVIQTIATKSLLSPYGVMVCLYGKNDSIKAENHGIIEYKKKTMGVTSVSFMKWSETNE